MDLNNLQPLKGFRDFLPEEAKKRQYVIDKIKAIFELYAFEPLETPALEYKDLLAGKVGSEAEKLMYFFKDQGEREVGLRYDQTVPTARILANYQNELVMPWKRFQIQPVWRADKPQKGRYREFLQCDADIYGCKSPIADAECVNLGFQLFKLMGFKKIKVYINDRNTLFQIMDFCRISKDLQLSVIQTIDKLDRKSNEQVALELKEKGLDEKTIEHLFDHINNAKPTEYLKKVIDYAENLGTDPESLIFQARLARGLDYYTSTIFEIKIDGYEAGSVLGGGRYNNLIKDLSGIDIPAVGFAIGFDRIVEAMEQFNLIPDSYSRPLVLVSIFNPQLSQISLSLVSNLRNNGIASEIYPDLDAKLDKQIKYADKKKIKWFVVIGPDEYKNNTVVLKNLISGHQEEVSLQKLIENIQTSS